MVSLAFADACAARREISFSHAGLSFRTRADKAGHVALNVPALQTPALFTAAYGDDHASASAPVPDLARVDRLAVSWSGPAPLELHAFEFGAGYGDPGHVWTGWPGQHPGAGGRIDLLGDAGATDPHRVQVYSFPAGTALRSKDVRLRLEMPVKPATCGHVVAARTLGVTGGQASPPMEISVDVPPCDGSGGYVVMGGLIPEWTVAVR